MPAIPPRLPATPQVGEALRFAAQLRLPRAWSSAEREALVAGVVELVELGEVEHRLVGTPGGGGVGVEGGEWG